MDADARSIGLKYWSMVATDLMKEDEQPFQYADLSWDNKAYLHTPIMTPFNKLHPIPPTYKAEHEELLTSNILAVEATDIADVTDYYCKGYQADHTAW